MFLKEYGRVGSTIGVSITGISSFGVSITVGRGI
jgi:hypothetical protein